MSDSFQRDPHLELQAAEAVAELRRLHEAATDGGEWFVAARPTDDGLSIIEDGRSSGIFPITGEHPQIVGIVAAVNALPALLTCAEALPRALARVAELEAEVARKDAALRDIRTKTSTYGGATIVEVNHLADFALSTPPAGDMREGAE